jgi:ParB family chromosome partitioning protein
MMAIESIQVSPDGYSDLGDLNGLADFIRARGVIVPFIVATDGRLLAGRRRFEAARRAGLGSVPVCPCDITDERTAIEISLIENVERGDLDPLTRARSYRALIERGATVEYIASLIGQGIGHVYQHLALLDLHPKVQEAIESRALSFADARALVPLEADDQIGVLQEIRGSIKPLSSRQVKARVDARRVMRLVQKTEPSQEQDGGTPQGNYAALFETEETANLTETPGAQSNPFDLLSTIIVEMVAAAQGEDQLRAWARRLSHILEQLQAMRREAERKKKSASALQDRLL